VAAVSAYTLLVGVALVIAHPGPSTIVDVVRLSVVAGLGAFAVVNCRIRERREARLLQVSEVARVAQAAILQPVPTRAGRWELASRYRSSAASADVGGDLLEVLPTETGARAIIGDVSGKGLLAVRLAATALTSFREACTQQELPLPEVARRVDHSVLQRSGEEEFVTAVLADFDDRGWLHVVNCGHPPPLRLTAGGELQALSPKVATSPLTLSPALRSDTYSVAPGDRVLLYTDGLLEARNAAGEFFPLHEQVALLAGDNLQGNVALLIATVPPDRD
jgi:serine phosphatase RsbU (regulator of sigma subunit)